MIHVGAHLAPRDGETIARLLGIPLLLPCYCFIFGSSFGATLSERLPDALARASGKNDSGVYRSHLQDIISSFCWRPTPRFGFHDPPCIYAPIPVVLVARRSFLSSGLDHAIFEVAKKSRGKLSPLRANAKMCPTKGAAPIDHKFVRNRHFSSAINCLRSCV